MACVRMGSQRRRETLTCLKALLFRLASARAETSESDGLEVGAACTAERRFMPGLEVVVRW